MKRDEIGRSTNSLHNSYEFYFGPRKDNVMSNAEKIRQDQSDLVRQLIEARQATLKNAVDALLKGFKPEDIVDALARALQARGDAALNGGDFDAYHAFSALSDDLWGSEDRIANYEPPDQDGEPPESAFERRMREYREKERD